MNDYTLVMPDDELGDIFVNSGPLAEPLIDAGKMLTRQYPGMILAVKQGDTTLWSNKKSAPSEAGDTSQNG